MRRGDPGGSGGGEGKSIFFVCNIIGQVYCRVKIQEGSVTGFILDLQKCPLIR